MEWHVTQPLAKSILYATNSHILLSAVLEMLISYLGAGIMTPLDFFCGEQRMTNVVLMLRLQ